MAMARKTKLNRTAAVKEIEDVVSLLDKCLEVSQRKRLLEVEWLIALAQLELRKEASRLLES